MDRSHRDAVPHHSYHFIQAQARLDVLLFQFTLAVFRVFCNHLNEHLVVPLTGTIFQLSSPPVQFCRFNDIVQPSQ
ncbi:hypothetical protein SUGI_0716440 [Cryptomeria japonica]|nr:hypothetical protein SUGI_0716440 [Cryptomeria japonica]